MFTSREVYGLTPMQGSYQAGVGSTPASTMAPEDNAPPWHPDNPLFWFGAVLLTTFGLIGASSSLRFGPVRASVAAGKG